MGIVAVAVNDFLSSNAWWIALCAAALVAIVIVCIFLFAKRKKKEAKEEAPKKKIDLRKKEVVKATYFDALGGEENVIERKVEGSRICLKLNDYSKIDKEKLKEAGVDGFIQMSNKLYLVVKNDAKKVYSILFGED